MARIRTDQRPETRDLSLASREIAIAMATRTLTARGEPLDGRIVVVDGPSAGAALPLLEEGRIYAVGHDDRCDLRLDDATPERFVFQVVRRNGLVAVRDVGGDVPAFLGEVHLAPGGDAHWKPAVTLQIGPTSFTLNEPVAEALAALEDAPDEALAADDVPPPSDAPSPGEAREAGRAGRGPT